MHSVCMWECEPAKVGGHQGLVYKFCKDGIGLQGWQVAVYRQCGQRRRLCFQIGLSNAWQWVQGLKHSLF